MLTEPQPPISPSNDLTIPLVAYHLRFRVRATSPIIFDEFKGGALRGALVNVLQRTFCPVLREGRVDPAHEALCPVCRLLRWDGDDEGGDPRRPYAIEPPLDAQTRFAPGEAFEFGVALYGDTWSYFPYVALAAGGMGEFGVGKRVPTSPHPHADGPRPSSRRGTFVVEMIESVNPFSGEQAVLLAPGERLVRNQSLPVTQAHIRAASDELLDQLAEQNNYLRIDFLTPMRLTQGEHIVKTPQFFPLAKAIVLRILDLCAQHAGGRPDVVLKRDLYPFADAVKLVESNTHWWDLKGYSSRLGRPQVLGGFVGSAWYYAPDWRPLLSWLLWGMSTHVGKNIVKGCGIYRLVRSC